MITLVLSESSRSLIYLKQIIKHKINFKKIILYSKYKKNVYKFIREKELTNYCIFLKTNNINSSIIERKLRSNKSKLNIISTYSGEIINNPKIFKYKLLHCHPGNLPMFQGSTTIYYTIILKKKICVTLFEITKKIDSGKILYKKYFKIPENLVSIERDFDNMIRALTLVEFLRSKLKRKYYQTKKNYLPYYIAHPLIRQIVINKDYLRVVSLSS
jgi:methionyl-tRNA formyltransferase